MDTVIRSLIGSECHVLMDDIICFSSSAEENAQRLKNILRRFDDANLQLHPGKCIFAQPRVKYLGFVLSEDGISASPDKVKAVRDSPVPKSVKEVRGFLGLASFYRRLIPNFVEVAKSLTILTHKNQGVTWGANQQQAFQSMKDKLCTTPVLAYPNFKLLFILKMTPATLLLPPFCPRCKMAWNGQFHFRIGNSTQWNVHTQHLKVRC
jgi:hypothetical protein